MTTQTILRAPQDRPRMEDSSNTVVFLLVKQKPRPERYPSVESVDAYVKKLRRTHALKLIKCHMLLLVHANYRSEALGSKTQSLGDLGRRTFLTCDANNLVFFHRR